jgi:hypothetical protein
MQIEAILTEFPERIEPAASHVGQLQRGRAQVAHRRHIGQQRAQRGAGLPVLAGRRRLAGASFTTVAISLATTASAASSRCSAASWAPTPARFAQYG